MERHAPQRLLSLNFSLTSLNFFNFPKELMS